MSADEGGIKGDQDRGDGEDSERVREKEKDGDMTDGPSTAEVMHQVRPRDACAAHNMHACCRAVQLMPPGLVRALPYAAGV